MIKVASLQTTIIDDMDLACQELADQLSSKLTLLRNSVGIVQCDPEFLEEGIMETLCGVLPIPLVGGTTISMATNDAMGRLMFSVLVMTSDDVDFVASCTTGIADDCAGALQQAIEGSLKSSKLPLSLAIIFPTVTNNTEVPGNVYIEAVESVCGEVPVFGTLSVNDSIMQFERSMSICNTSVSKQEMSYVLIFGDVKPRFFVSSIPPQLNVIESEAIITKVRDQVICEINHMPAVRYFEDVGFASAGKLNPGVYFVPMILTYVDPQGSSHSFVRALVSFDEYGGAVCRASVPLGSSIAFGLLSDEGILDATRELVGLVNKEEDVSAVIFFSCLIRQFNIGSDAMKELSVIRDTLRNDIPFLASYSGGEISPMYYRPDNNKKSLFHNYALIACLI